MQSLRLCTLFLAHMEAAGLYHDSYRGIIICIEHQFALIPAGIRAHLRNLHRCKSEVLHAVEQQLDSIDSPLHDPTTIRQPSHHSPRILRLAVRSGFACDAPNCEKQADWLSEGRRYVEKHQARYHGAPDRRSKQGRLHAEQNPEQIKSVSFQSIFPRPYYRPFIIQEPQQEESGVVIEQTETELPSSYRESQKAGLAELDIVSTDVHKSQAPPWIRKTGIAGFLAGVEKERIKGLLAEPRREDDDGLAYVSEAVYERLQSISNQVEIGHADSRFSRLSARQLNSFEPDRTQARPFEPAQELSTLRRYAGKWSSLIICLVRMQSSEYREGFKERHY